jgi:hypothetical protein
MGTVRGREATKLFKRLKRVQRHGNHSSDLTIHLRLALAGCSGGDILRKEEYILKFCGILKLEEALKAVERNGDALRYVKEQTEAVCLKAVERNGYALQYVKEQTEAVCLKAVERNGDALQYVLEMKLFFAIAIKLNISVVR